MRASAAAALDSGVAAARDASHVRDGKITEFWSATTDPQASVDL